MTRDRESRAAHAGSGRWTFPGFGRPDGQTTVEYLGAVIVVSVLALAIVVVLPGVGSTLTGRLAGVICTLGETMGAGGGCVATDADGGADPGQAGGGGVPTEIANGGNPGTPGSAAGAGQGGAGTPGAGQDPLGIADPSDGAQPPGTEDPPDGAQPPGATDPPGGDQAPENTDTQPGGQDDGDVPTAALAAGPLLGISGAAFAALVRYLSQNTINAIAAAPPTLRPGTPGARSIADQVIDDVLRQIRQEEGDDSLQCEDVPLLSGLCRSDAPESTPGEVPATPADPQPVTPGGPGIPDVPVIPGLPAGGGGATGSDPTPVDVIPTDVRRDINGQTYRDCLSAQGQTFLVAAGLDCATVLEQLPALAEGTDPLTAFPDAGEGVAYCGTKLVGAGATPGLGTPPRSIPVYTNPATQTCTQALASTAGDDARYCGLRAGAPVYAQGTQDCAAALRDAA